MEKLKSNFKIQFTKGDTYALSIKIKGITEELKTAIFTVKENPDDEPLIQKTLGAGISKTDDRYYKKEKTYKLQIQSGDTLNCEANIQYLYDLQVSIDNVVKTILSGVFVVNHSVSGVNTITSQTLDVAVDDELQAEFETTPATAGVEYETDPVANAKIGDLKALNTTHKETIVGAVNEVKTAIKTNEDEIADIKNGNVKIKIAEQADVAGNADKISNLIAEKDEEEKTLNFRDLTGFAYKFLNAVNAKFAESANTVNGIEIDVYNRVLQADDCIIPQKKYLWSGNLQISAGGTATVKLTEEVLAGEEIEFRYKYYTSSGFEYYGRARGVVYYDGTQDDNLYLNVSFKNIGDHGNNSFSVIKFVRELNNLTFTNFTPEKDGENNRFSKIVITDILKIID